MYMQHISFYGNKSNIIGKRYFIFIWKVWPKIECKNGWDAGLLSSIE